MVKKASNIFRWLSINYTLKYFGNYWKEAYWFIIYIAHIILLLKDKGYISIFHAIWEAAGLDKVVEKVSAKRKQSIFASDFNIFGGIDSFGEPFLGSKYCNCSSISSAVTFRNKKFTVLSIDDFILRILGCVSKRLLLLNWYRLCPHSMALVYVY